MCNFPAVAWGWHGSGRVERLYVITIYNKTQFEVHLWFCWNQCIIKIYLSISNYNLNLGLVQGEHRILFRGGTRNWCSTRSMPKIALVPRPEFCSPHPEGLNPFLLKYIVKKWVSFFTDCTHIERYLLRTFQTLLFSYSSWFINPAYNKKLQKFNE